MKPVAERKHLPAPPLGQITGHGMTLEKLKQKTELREAYEEDHKEPDWTQEWRS